jgi:ParB-like chromosome segregation protein Spo0J
MVRLRSIKPLTDVDKTAWPADRVERRSVDALVPYARNARKHTPGQVRQVAASIKEWGWTIPVLIDEQGGIIAGHARILAAQKLGLVSVPVMIAIGWPEDKKAAYIIADNKLALNAEWDDETLKSEFERLEESFDLDLTGFSDRELDRLLGDEEDEAGRGASKLAGFGFSIVVECTNEEEQAKLLQRLEDEGLKCRCLMT